MINHTHNTPCLGRRKFSISGCMGILFIITLSVVIWIGMSSTPLSFQMLRLYPKKSGSAVVGWLASRRLPPPLREVLLGAFVKHYRINLLEAEKELKDYESLQEFFTRRLKPGLRPQSEALPGYVNSPVDGQIIASGRIAKGTILQAKGLPYQVPDLLRHLPTEETFEGGHYLTLYLSPKDYHRIHVPLEGLVNGVARVEGELWPVNEMSTSRVERLYVRNRRSAWLASGTGPDEGLTVAAVLVGATHVGGVILDNRWLEGKELPHNGGFSVEKRPCTPGDDLGTFQFGSTVVLLIGGPKADQWRPIQQEGSVRMGQRLGIFE